jgi:transcriptional regulator with XRE-family HTH domain
MQNISIEQRFAFSGKRLLNLRRALGYSQNIWCGVLGIKQPSLSNIENGHTHISVVHALIIHEHTGVTLDWIYLGMEQGLPPSLANAIAKLDVEPALPVVVPAEWPLAMCLDCSLFQARGHEGLMKI